MIGASIEFFAHSHRTPIAGWMLAIASATIVTIPARATPCEEPPCAASMTDMCDFCRDEFGCRIRQQKLE